MRSVDRRGFLKGVGASVVAGATAWEALLSASPARAEDAKVTPEMVRFGPEMEPVVRWIEMTPRDRVFQTAVEELKKGLSYRQLLGGLFLAGIRNIKPRPVGFKFHAVMVIDAAHQLGLDAPQADRLLPLFWALDNFKGSQEQDVRDGDWQLGPVKASAVPSASDAKRRFVEAMDRWDEEAADAAVAGLYRAAGTGEVVETLWRYGARDWQNIGHKIIFTAHSFRTLQTIGWEHAEPVLRSLVFGLLTGGDGDTAAPYARNLALAATVRADWPAGKADPEATKALLGVLRQAKPEDAAAEAVRALNGGIAAASLWDAVLLAAGEFLMRKPGIVALHALTASNSLHHAFESSGVDSSRLLMLLQACSWICLYREAIRARGGLPESPLIDQLEPAEGAESPSVEEIFGSLAKDRTAAARQVLAYASRTPGHAAFLDAARHLVFTKGTDSHDYKYAAAVTEEVRRASPALRPRLLAAAAYQLRGASEPDSPLIHRTRQALSAL